MFLKKKDATRKDIEKIMEELVRETGLQMTLEFYYEFLVLSYIEEDEKMEARKHYFGLTYDNQPNHSWDRYAKTRFSGVHNGISNHFIIKVI